MNIEMLVSRVDQTDKGANRPALVDFPLDPNPARVARHTCGPVTVVRG